MVNYKQEYGQLEIMQLIMHNTNELIWAVDNHYCLLFANKAYQKSMLSVGVNEIQIGQNILSIDYPEEKLDFWKTNYDRCFNDETFEIISQFSNLDGLRYIEHSLKPLKDETGIICGAISISRDITDKKKIENELIIAREKVFENELRLKMSLTASKSGTWDWNIVDDTFHWSDEFLKIFGMSENTVAGFASWIKVLHPDDVDIASRKIKESVENKTDLFSDYRIILPDNSIQWIRSLGSTYYENDKPVRMLGICLNITDSKNTENELIISKEKTEDSERKYLTIFDRAPVIISISDLNTGEYIDVNSFALEISGFSREEVIGKKSVEIGWIDIENRKLLTNALKENGRIENLEISFNTKSGTEIYGLVNGERIVYNNRDCLLTITNDITIRKNIKNELIIAKEIAEESKNKLKFIFDTISEGIALNECVFNEQGEMIDYKILDVNNAFYNLADYKGDKIIGNLASELYGMSHDFIKSFWKQHKNLNQTVFSEYKSPLQDRWYFISTSPFEENKFVTAFFDITDRKLSELALKESEKKFRFFFESNTSGVAVINTDTSISIVNEAFCKIGGFSNKEEIIGLSWTKLIAHDDLERLKEINIQRLINPQDAPDSYEFSFYRKNGEIRQARISVFYSHEMNKIFASFIDITEQKKSEKELKTAQEIAKENEILNKNILQTIPFGMDIVDENGIILYQNDNLKRLFGETAIGKKCWEMYRDDKTQCKECPLKFIGKQNGETNIYISEGALGNRTLRIFHTDITFKGKKAVLEIFEDITDIQKSEKALKHSHDLLKYIIEHNRSAVAVHDKNYKYVYVSQPYLEQYNLKETEIIGKHHYDVFPDLPQKWRDVHQKALTGIVSSAEDDPFYRANGTIEWTRWECRPWYDSEGSIGGFIIYTETITERKKMEIELQNAKEKAEEGDRLKTNFLNNMSHEIRTPLNAIQGFSQLMARPNQPPEKLKKYSEMIRIGTEKLISIISDVIEISQIHANQFQINLSAFDFILLIKNLVNKHVNFAKEKSIELILTNKCPQNELQINSDKDKLFKIFNHLIDNAIKFTMQGLVEIIVDIQNINKFSYQLVITIKDTGIGISADMQKIIFEPFRQVESGIIRSFGGNGLGLALAKSYVKMLNGSITLESEINIGTKFMITIPINIQSTQLIQSSLKYSSRAIETVLIAEDEYSNYIYLAELLDEYNLTILYAENGQKAFDLVKNRNDIDLIFMDIKMPIIDGCTSAKLIKELWPDLPIIAQTSYALEIDKEKYISFFDDYITKPIDVKELKQKLLKYFNH